VKRAYITFADGELYESLAGVLDESIMMFSEYPLIIYRKYDLGLNADDDLSKSGYKYKLLACLKSLELYDEVVWLDTDCLVTSNIDKIWFESWRIEDYPLLPKHRFFNSVIWLANRPNYNDPNFIKPAKDRVGITEHSFENVYLQACFMFFNKECRNFFKEAISYYDGYDSNVFQFGDETILNCMIWKRFGYNLGSVFLCSCYHSPDFLESVIKTKNRDEYKSLFDRSVFNTGYGYYTWSEHMSSDRSNPFPLPILENNFENIMFFHGSKDPILHRHYLSCMKENRKERFKRSFPI
jgi:hypothetical protein